MVDNSYGEIVERIEPSDVGADMVVGSLIKNPGGGLAPIGGYIVGTKECVENAAYRLAINIKKTQKRANALKNITIPKYEELTKSISNALEEKEREEFTRLKVIKRMQGK